jgi:integrase
MDKQTLINPYGKVRLYTRHSLGCSEEGCSCPWWIYINPKGGKVQRKSLSTNDEAEAIKLADMALQELRPETARTTGRTPLESIMLFINRRELDGHTGTRTLYRSVLGCVGKKGQRQGLLLSALDEARITDVRDITTQWLQDWYQGRDWSRYKPTSLKARWVIIRTFFSFLYTSGVIASNPALPIKSIKSNGHFNNIPLAPEQYQRILDKTSDVRLKYFLELLRWTGSDLGDAVMFKPSNIDQEGTYRYHRQKTKNRCVIPLEPHALPMLRNVPLVEGYDADMPFMDKSKSLRNNQVHWYLRLKELFKEAGVTKLTMLQSDGTITTKTPTPKCLRHTFATDCLSKGYDVGLVATMLGHASAVMTEKAYLPWCEQRDLAHVAKVREMQQAAAKKQQALNIPAREGEAVTG